MYMTAYVQAHKRTAAKDGPGSISFVPDLPSAAVQIDSYSCSSS